MAKPNFTTKRYPFTQTWTIENFADYCRDDSTNGVALLTDPFSPPAHLKLPNNLSAAQFILTIFPNGDRENTRNFVTISVGRDSPQSQPLNLLHQFLIIDANNQKHKFAPKISQNVGGGFSSGWGKWISTADILNPENGYLANGHLTVCLDASILVTEKMEEPLSKEFSKSGSEKILDNLSNLWKMRHEYSDVVIEVSGGAELPAHKAMLVAQSPVFAAMFRHKTTRESQENRIIISDMSVQVCEVLLKYLYTGIVESLESWAEVLLPLVDKYQIDHLKSICEQTLCATINSENVKQLKRVAEQNNSKLLLEKCSDFIKKRTLESVKNLIENQGKAEEIEKMLAIFD